jgi:hypothetical protein
MKKEETYAIKLSWKATWIVLTMLVTTIGSSFGVGIKIASELNKIELAKLEQKFLDELEQKKEEMYTLRRASREHEENAIFYKNQYIIYKGRFEKCDSKSTELYHSAE